MCENQEDEAILLNQIEPLLEMLVSETEVGLATAKNTQRTIANSSRFASLRKWDECLSILHRHVAASKHQLSRIDRVINQLHRILDNAEDTVSELEDLDLKHDEVDFNDQS